MVDQILQQIADSTAWIKRLAAGSSFGSPGRIGLLAILTALAWGTQRADPLGSTGKSIWDRLILLAIPMALVTAVRPRSRPDCDKDQEVHQQGTETAAALQTYRDYVQATFCESDLHASESGNENWMAVSAKTLDTLRTLDGTGKGLLLRFLHDAGLIDTDKTMVDLMTANLSKAELKGADLGWGSLRRVDLTGADLSEAVLIEANLIGADLSGANLTRACLGSADLRGANLGNVDLRWADLRETDLRMAVLSGANLLGADLRMANLSGADLSRAKLSGAALGEADLTGANLSGAAVNSDQLAQAKPLELVVMPNGTRHDQALCPSGV